MPNTCGYHDDITGTGGQDDALLPAELHFCDSAAHAKNFVSRAVIVMKRINAVAPGSSPSVGCEHFFARICGITLSEVYCILIDQQRQGVVIGDFPIILESVVCHARGFDKIAEVHFS